MTISNTITTGEKLKFNKIHVFYALIIIFIAGIIYCLYNIFCIADCYFQILTERRLVYNQTFFYYNNSIV